MSCFLLTRYWVDHAREASPRFATQATRNQLRY